MRTIKADLHGHGVSIKGASNIKFNPIIDQAAKSLGQGGIVGLVNFVGPHTTPQHEHIYERFAQLSGYDRVNFGNSIYVPEKDILVVKGEEVELFEGGLEYHLLLLGTEEGENIKPARSLIATLEETQRKNSIVVLDHPMNKLGAAKVLADDSELLDYLLSKADAIEVYNGCALIPDKNKQSEEFFKTVSKNFPHLGGIISSDGHSLREIGSSYTLLEMPFNYKGFCDSSEVNYYLERAIHNSKNPRGKKGGSKINTLNHILELFLYFGPKEMINRSKS